MTNEEKILEFLNNTTIKYPLSTGYIGKHSIAKEYYENHPFAKTGGHIGWSDNLVDRTYYYLNKLRKQNKVEYIPRGMWKLKNDNN